MERKSWIVLSILLFLADRTLKWYALNMTTPYEAGFFTFGRFINPSLFFFPAWPWIPWAALTVLVVIITLYALRSTLYAPLLPIILGGTSNVFDRFAYSGVIDIIHIGGLATINLADIMILLGLLSLLVHPAHESGIRNHESRN